MKPLNERDLTDRDVKDLLTPRQRPTPPADLAERIKREIPADLPVIQGLTEDAEAAPAVPLSRSRIWLMAASVVMAVGGGFLGLRWMDRMPTPSETVSANETTAVEAVNAAKTEGASDRVDITADVDASTVEPNVAGAVEDLAPAAESSAEPASATPVETSGPRAPAEPIPATPVGDPATPGDGASNRPRDEVVASPRDEVIEPEPQPEGSVIQLGLSQRMEQAERARSLSAPTPPPPAPVRPEAQASPEAGVREMALASEGSRAQDKQVQAPPPPPPPSPRRSRPRPPAARAPVPEAPAESVPSREDQLRSLAYVDDSRLNRSVEYGNPKIRDMRAEAEALEAELKALEASSPTRPAAASTGGTAEPNDAPYGDVFFDSAGTNPFVDTEDDAQSTFGLDVDTGSYTVARRYLRDGHLPPPESVRVEEFINYFDYGDSPPEKAEFAIHAEGAPSIYGQGERYHLLRFNLSGRELAEAERRPALLTFVIDVSGSMSRENRLGLVKQALTLLIDQLRADDRLALVIYGSRGQVVLQPTHDHGAIRRAIDRLSTSGSTNAEEGLTLAYDLAARHRRQGEINRVILCSDGVANVGATSAGSILDRIRREANLGIELTTVGFGMGNYNDTLMEQLADTGNGRYAYVDALDEARRIFVESLTGTLQTLAAEARVQVEFDPETVARYRLLGYENRDIADHRFRDDTVDAGEIGVGHKVTALYEIKTERPLRATDRVGVLRLRYGSIEQREMVEIERVVTGADFAPEWRAASPALKLTSLVAEYAEILKRSYWAREGDLDNVFRRAQRLSAAWEGDREVADFVSLVAQAAEIKEREKRR